MVGSHQTYTIRERSIVRNIQAMRLVCEAAFGLCISAAVLQVDLSSGFHRVNQELLFDLL